MIISLRMAGHIMGSWTLDDIHWEHFDAAKVKPEVLPLIETAALVEHNGRDYARYLCEVFSDDPELQGSIHQWAEEEVQHGQALRQWAELANPAFDFEKSFKIFTEGYKLPQNVAASVRGSQAGELLARCVVEAGTSSYYTAIREYTDEPVLKEVCARIAADEFRHYKLFYTCFNQYLLRDRIGMMKRLAIVVKRVAESEDDELAYAFFSARPHQDVPQYERKKYAGYYLFYACLIYRRRHIERMTAMVFKAIGLKPHTRLHGLVALIGWKFMQLRQYFTVAAPLSVTRAAA